MNNNECKKNDSKQQDIDKGVLSDGQGKYGHFNSQMNQPPPHALAMLNFPKEKTWMEKYGAWMAVSVICIIILLGIGSKIRHIKTAGIGVIMIKIANKGADAGDLKSLKSYYRIIHNETEKECGNKPKEQADYEKCKTNTKIIGISCIAYSLDNGMRNPPSLEFLEKSDSSKCGEAYMDSMPKCPCGGTYRCIVRKEQGGRRIIIKCLGNHGSMPAPEFDSMRNYR